MDGVAIDHLKTWPSTIYLQHGGAKDECEYPGRDAVTWCDHAINESDIEYVRADRFQDAWKLAVEALEFQASWLESFRAPESSHDAERKEALAKIEAALSTLKEKL